ncbi:MAG: hypothetical protein ACOX81_03950 [Candidatus Heteroscillospira sp.]
MAKITANFSDRDSANLTLMRLRRTGVDFDLLKLTSRPAEGQSTTASLLFGMNATPAETITCPQRREDVTQDALPTEMQLSVKSSHLEKAWDVLRSTGAKNIQSRN